MLAAPSMPLPQCWPQPPSLQAPLPLLGVQGAQPLQQRPVPLPCPLGSPLPVLQRSLGARPVASPVPLLLPLLLPPPPLGAQGVAAQPAPWAVLCQVQPLRCWAAPPLLPAPLPQPAPPAAAAPERLSLGCPRPPSMQLAGRAALPPPRPPSAPPLCSQPQPLPVWQPLALPCPLSVQQPPWQPLAQPWAAPPPLALSQWLAVHPARPSRPPALLPLPLLLPPSLLLEAPLPRLQLPAAVGWAVPLQRQAQPQPVHPCLPLLLSQPLFPMGARPLAALGGAPAPPPPPPPLAA